MPRPVQTAGAKLSIGTNNTALATESDWTEVGEVESFGEFGPRDDLVTFTSVGNRNTQKYKGARNDGTMSVVVGRVPSDEGQTKLREAQDDLFLWNFMVEFDDAPDAGTPTTIKMQAMVMSYTTNLGGIGDVIKASVTLEVETGTMVETPASGTLAAGGEGGQQRSGRQRQRREGEAQQQAQPTEAR